MLLYFTKLQIFLGEVNTIWLPNFICVINLVIDMDDWLYQCLFAMKMQRFKTEHLSMLCLKDRKQNAIQA